MRDVFGDSRRVPLVNVEVKLCGEANGEKVTDGKPVMCAVVPFREVIHNMVLPNDVVTDLRCLSVMSVMCEGVLAKDVSGVSIADDTDDDSADDVVLDVDQLPAGGCVSGETDVKEPQEKDDSLNACWKMVRAGKDYLAERMGEYVQFSLYFVWLVCYILSFCIFVSGSQWGWAAAENEAHAINWAFSRFGDIVCGYQIAVMCEYNLLQYVFYLKFQVVVLLPVVTGV